MTHPDLRPLLSDEPSAERAALLGHLQVCGTCRETLAAQDASRLFALLALEPVPEGLLERLSSAVDDEIGHDSGPAVGHRSWGWPAASLAASLVLAASFTTYVYRGRPPAVPGSPGQAAQAAHTETQEIATAEPGFELLSSPGEARVVDLAVGEVQLVMIFDEELDL